MITSRTWFPPETEYLELTEQDANLTVTATAPRSQDGVNGALCLTLQLRFANPATPHPSPGVHTAFWGSAWAGPWEDTLHKAPSPAPGTRGEAGLT